MKRSKYIVRSLFYFRKQHLSLLIGTIISTAVLTGALIVGDSVSHSLELLTQKRLGKIEYALQSGERYVSDELASGIEKEEGIQAASLLHLDAMLIEPQKDIRMQSTSLYGIDTSFCYFSGLPEESITRDALMISENVAKRLDVGLGEELLIKFRDPDALPVQSLFAQEEVNYLSLRLAVSRILNDEELGLFSLRTDQKAPYNLFVNKRLLQDRAELKDKSNLLVFELGNEEQRDWDQVLKKSLKAGDASLHLNSLEDIQRIEVTSDRVFIDESIVDTLVKQGASKILTYLVNTIQQEKKQTPYSFVSGLSRELLPYSLKEDEIILNDWCADDLGVGQGDSVSLTYFSIDAFRQLNTEHKRFFVKSIEKNQVVLFRKDLMPDFPGLSDAKSCSEWDTGLPIDLDKIRDKDEEYWEEFKGTPKAIVSYESAEEMWANQYGKATALRLLDSGLELIENNFGALLSPDAIGLKVKEVKKEGWQAASNGVDFGELFLSLSFFVIVSGVFLLVLLYSFNLLARRQEIEKLSALGLSKKGIFRLFFYEILFPLLVGNLLGVVLGILYNRAILYGLNGLWQDAVRTQALEVFINPFSLLTGFLAGVVISVLTVYLVLRNMLRKKNIFFKAEKTKSWLRSVLFVLALLSLLVSVYYLIQTLLLDTKIASSTFMAIGALLMVALLLFLWLFVLDRSRKKNALPSLDSLALENLSKNKSRSMLTISLLAFATFSVLVTGMNRKSFQGLEAENASPTGGYLFWMESTFPLNYDPNTERGKEQYGFADDERFDSISFLPMLTLAGDDASCLNLNQVENPGLLGIDPSIPSERSSFSFTQLIEGMDQQDPWSSLDKKFGDGVIPGFVDQTVITWGLIKEVGDTLSYTDEMGRELKVIIAGGLANTIFQGYVLISQQNMQKYYPSVPGAKVCLVDADEGKVQETGLLLDEYFRDFGIDYTTTYDKLAEFNSVTNTYLNVFLALGAIGLLIGTFGFGIVLLRNRLERRKERAILSAIGISSKGIRSLLIKEHLFLLFAGTSIALVASLYAAIPSFLSKAFNMPYLFLLIILLLILLSGVFWIYVFSGIRRKENLIEYLRKE